jgi:hypothetical protein
VYAPRLEFGEGLKIVGCMVVVADFAVRVEMCTVWSIAKFDGAKLCCAFKFEMHCKRARSAYSVGMLVRATNLKCLVTSVCAKRSPYCDDVAVKADRGHVACVSEIFLETPKQTST